MRGKKQNAIGVVKFQSDFSRRNFGIVRPWVPF